jgi:hypothetical protein
MGARWWLTGGAALMMTACAGATETRPVFAADAHPKWVQALVSGTWVAAVAPHVIEQRCRLLDHDLREELARHHSELTSAVVVNGLPSWYRVAAERLLPEIGEQIPCGDRAAETLVAYGMSYARELVADLHVPGMGYGLRPIDPVPNASRGLDADLHPRFTQAMVSGLWIRAAEAHAKEQHCKLLEDDLRDELARDHAALMSALAAAALPAWYRMEVEKLLSQADTSGCGDRTRKAAFDALLDARIWVAELRRTADSPGGEKTYR